LSYYGQKFESRHSTMKFTFFKTENIKIVK